MKFIFALLLMLQPIATFGASEKKCKIIDQSGTQDMPDCGNWDYPIRCYAEVQYDDGYQLTVWGSCTSKYQDCWWNGNSAVTTSCAN